MPSSGAERLPFVASSAAEFTGPSFEWGDFAAAQRVVRKVVRRFRRERAFDPCTGTRMRPRQAARRRRDQRRRRTNNPSRGDPDPHLDADALLDDLHQSGGREYLDLSRAAFAVFHQWDRRRFHASLDAAIETGRAFTFDDGNEVWIVARRAAA